jgi:nucleotide-binding universal stress UspA family protein
MAIKMILVPVDFSSHSERALKLALELAKALGARVHVFHCFQVLVGGRAPLGSTGLDPKLREDAQASLEQWVGGLEKAGVSVEAELLPRPYPSEAILDAAQKTHPDLIVMGTRGTSGLKHIFLGSVAERVVREAPCPVVTVKDG